MCEAAVDLGAAAKGMEVVVRYEADLLTLESCVTIIENINKFFWPCKKVGPFYCIYNSFVVRCSSEIVALMR